MKATHYTVSAAALALQRIAGVLHTVETLTARKRTPGREQTIEDLDDLSGWDSHVADVCRDLGIDIWGLAGAAQGHIENLTDAWTEHGIHGKERAALND